MNADIESAIDRGESKEEHSPRDLLLHNILEEADDEAQLLRRVAAIDGDHVERVAVLGFRSLQLVRIAHLQAALIREQNDMFNVKRPVAHSQCRGAKEKARGGPRDGARIDNLLQRYADAIRNYETLAQRVPFEKNTAFEFLGSGQYFRITQRASNNAKWDRVSHGESTVPPYGLGPLGFRELDKKRLNQRQRKRALRQRLYMAVFGGLSILVPVIIMSVRFTKLREQLIVTSVATLVFTLVVGLLGTDSSGKDVLTSTTAYAAVLSVFLGVTLQNE